LSLLEFVKQKRPRMPNGDDLDCNGRSHMISI
jgi:hypothetical protein